MTKNMGSLDKTVRLIAAVVLIALAATGTIGGVFAIAAYVVAAIFVVTSMVSVCPAYLPFGISTRK
ncbi:DUF2892 domain-containing protein [Qipengyuania sp. 1NDW9]|uniref:DUF2892 domain-containing protein n=1 Tax=Qipengyuania aquimaris TaxID=255984 RepID=A0A9Q3XCJ6_9SPHN|nr:MULTISPECIES: DUF2892 domain-containing protein [Qipengyuania]MBX7493904.1 DUF2892 domain-containing protein [Qipengyuania xiapuensis]MBY6216910.1 DUF2892 domain-containing protein [Qipengyuania aquimaris]